MTLHQRPDSTLCDTATYYSPPLCSAPRPAATLVDTLVPPSVKAATVNESGQEEFLNEPMQRNPAQYITL